MEALQPLPSNSLKGLIVTDLMFPGGEKAPAMRRWLRSQGATVPLESVSAYDYLYDMNRAGVFVDRVDVTITFGYCYSSYNSLATDMVDTDADKSPYNSSNKRQYRWLPKQNHLHHLNESLFGQNAGATNIILGPAYQIDAVKQTCKSFPATVVRLHIPLHRNGQPILGIRMGRGCKFSQGHVLMAHVSGPNTHVVNSHMVRTSSGEVQLDLCSLITSTLRANGTVISLASGECRLFELLKHNDAFTAIDKGAPIIAGDVGGYWGKKVIHPQFNTFPFRGFLDHATLGPRDTHACTRTGRLNLVAVSEWTQNNWLQWVPRDAYLSMHAQRELQRRRRTSVNDMVYRPF